MIEDYIRARNQQIQANIIDSFEKGGKPAVLGEVRMFAGKPHKKVVGGWRLVPKGAAQQTPLQKLHTYKSEFSDKWTSIDGKRYAGHLIDANDIFGGKEDQEHNQQVMETAVINAGGGLNKIFDNKRIWGKAEVKEVPLDQIHFINGHLHREMIEKKLGEAGDDDRAPQLIETDYGYYLLDGHHWTAKQKLLGKTSAKFTVGNARYATKPAEVKGVQSNYRWYLKASKEDPDPERRVSYAHHVEMYKESIDRINKLLEAKGEPTVTYDGKKTK